MHTRLQRLVVATWRLIRRYPFGAVALPVVVALSLSFCTREDSEWEAVYVVAANHLRGGADIYSDGNSYPPFAAFAALPWSFLSPGIILIRWAGLRPLKADAERRAQRALTTGWTAGHA